ncbi:uncharacterized protein LOC121994429 [Zingiber officinale]|uniref:Uncharacterized protein n=1 Tax=Zingiber officinale TaxID=94328 RepID=A0A8J5L1P7_ZINOF|nr:uncharacterized protein LOC121994429 [Zingiber officinale]KAG6501702.1 hypothetical protein ZIOFF_041585 [Zingiber officinale]
MESNKGGLKGFWKRRGYHRSDGGVTSRRRLIDTVELGGGGERIPPRRSRRARLSRIKIYPRIAFLRLRRAASPRRILGRIRDAYVRMMLKLSNAFPRDIYGEEGFGMQPMGKEYDEKVLFETYKAVMSSSACTASVAGLAMPF